MIWCYCYYSLCFCSILKIFATGAKNSAERWWAELLHGSILAISSSRKLERSMIGMIIWIWCSMYSLYASILSYYTVMCSNKRKLLSRTMEMQNTQFGQQLGVGTCVLYSCLCTILMSMCWFIHLAGAIPYTIPSAAVRLSTVNITTTIVYICIAQFALSSTVLIP